MLSAHQQSPSHIIIGKKKLIPKTTSGKVQRGRCRQMFENSDFEKAYFRLIHHIEK